LGSYLAIDNLTAARALLTTYPEQGIAAYDWALVLERFRSGKTQEANSALRTARMGNPFVELYFTGKREPPRRLPESYQLGSDEEAILLMVEHSVAWANHPEAVLWLAVEVQRHPMSKIAH